MKGGENVKQIKSKRTTKLSKKVMSVIVAMSFMILGTVGAFATGDTGTTPTLDINFDVSEMFTWAQTIINAMMPVLYIIMGVALGFLIIRAFKSAFN